MIYDVAVIGTIATVAAATVSVAVMAVWSIDDGNSVNHSGRQQMAVALLVSTIVVVVVVVVVMKRFATRIILTQSIGKARQSVAISWSYRF